MDFALREIEHRLIEAGARTECSINEHRVDLSRTWQTDQARWHTLVEEDICDRERQVSDEEAPYEPLGTTSQPEGDLTIP